MKKKSVLAALLLISCLIAINASSQSTKLVRKNIGDFPEVDPFGPHLVCARAVFPSGETSEEFCSNGCTFNEARACTFSNLRWHFPYAVSFKITRIREGEMIRPCGQNL